MKNVRLILVLSFFLNMPLYADVQQEAKAFITHIFEENKIHVDNISHEDFKKFSDKQTPRATIVACSDSRVQTNTFHQEPINDLFTVRNIGNQIATSEDSIEYGIYHLRTPILLIVGHSHCGAIAAATGDYSKELLPIQKELDNLHVKKKADVNVEVIENVHHQVDYALKKFKDKITSKELYVIGVVYDFRDDFKQGHGRLALINLNGEKDPKKIKDNALLKGIENISIGVD